MEVAVAEVELSDRDGLESYAEEMCQWGVGAPINGSTVSTRYRFRRLASLQMSSGVRLYLGVNDAPER